MYVNVNDRLKHMQFVSIVAYLCAGIQRNASVCLRYYHPIYDTVWYSSIFLVLCKTRGLCICGRQTEKCSLCYFQVYWTWLFLTLRID